MEKKSKRKRILATLLATVGIVSVTSALAFTASASDVDTDSTYGRSQYNVMWTEARTKDDYTSSYQKCVSAKESYGSRVYGSSSSNPVNIGQINYNLKNPSTGKATTTYSFSTGTTRYMVNYVKENNLKYAGMAFMPGGYGYSVHIKWSPDSV